MFFHQDYNRPGPQGEFQLLSPCPEDMIESDQRSASELAKPLRLLAAAGIEHIVLLRGTFVGVDPLGFARKLARLWPEGADWLQNTSRRVIDKIAEDGGNFVKPSLELLERARLEAGVPLEISIAPWSGENHHAGRADGALRLTGKIAEIQSRSSRTSRVLIIGHSHGGNVAALASQLWQADAATWQRFLRAGRTLCQSPWFRLGGWFAEVAPSAWTRAIQSNRRPQIDGSRCWVVTMGTPVRYGWGTCGRLIHFIHQGFPEPEEMSDRDQLWRAAFPPAIHAKLQGDLVQQLGIAGTNFSPSLLSYRVHLANSRLRRILNADVRTLQLYQRLKRGVRLHDTGLNLLTNYAAVDPHADDIWGHAVYTRRRWLAFHFRQIAAHCCH